MLVRPLLRVATLHNSLETSATLSSTSGLWSVTLKAPAKKENLQTFGFSVKLKQLDKIQQEVRGKIRQYQ
jgi:hypothetical protein